MYQIVGNYATKSFSSKPNVLENDLLGNPLARIFVLQRLCLKVNQLMQLASRSCLSLLSFYRLIGITLTGTERGADSSSVQIAKVSIADQRNAEQFTYIRMI
jgi:hypothetical protein